jgi:hypothetical protein
MCRNCLKNAGRSILKRLSAQKWVMKTVNGQERWNPKKVGKLERRNALGTNSGKRSRFKIERITIIYETGFNGDDFTYVLVLPATLARVSRATRRII